MKEKIKERRCESGNSVANLSDIFCFVMFRKK